MEAEKPVLLAGEADLFFKVGIPPRVVDIDGKPEVRWRAEGVADGVRALHRVDRRAVVGIHRMQRLDGELHAGLLGVRKKILDPGGDLVAGGFEGLRGIGPADEDQRRRADFRALVDGLEVVVEERLAAECRFGTEEPTAGEGDDFEAGVACFVAESGGLLVLEILEPEGDAFDACGGVALDALAGGPGFVGDGVEGEHRGSSRGQGDQVARK